MDQKLEPGIVAIASGYTMNTKPGPVQKQSINQLDQLTVKSQNKCRQENRGLFVTFQANLVDTLILHFGHVAQDRKDYESSEEACQTIDRAGDYSISEKMGEKSFSVKF